MARVLYLVHRMPYPPDKGDKVRSYHLLRHLAQRHEVYLATFVDDPADWAHVQTLQTWCREVKAVGLNPRLAQVRSLQGLVRGEPLSIGYYRSAELMRWVRELTARVRVDASVVFSSSMAPYALEVPGTGEVLLDFVDMDSAKWAEYGRRRSGPMGWVYGREGRLLGDYERSVARRARCSYFVAEHERALFLQQAPDCSDRVRAVGNGVDAEHFHPGLEALSPFAADEQPIVFTGAMDYWPNADAVTWFAQEMMPELLNRHPAARFHIVGRGAGPALQSLQNEAVRVTGAVPDVRPYQRHAAVVVAPMRLARGIQNKVLEGMAMGRAVVAASDCVKALGLGPDDGVLAADAPEAYAQAVSALLADPARAAHLGRQARRCVEQRFSWASHLAPLEADLQAALAARGAGPVVPGGALAVRGVA